MTLTHKNSTTIIINKQTFSNTKNSPYFFQLIIKSSIPWKKLQTLSRKRQKK